MPFWFFLLWMFFFFVRQTFNFDMMLVRLCIFLIEAAKKNIKIQKSVYFFMALRNSQKKSNFFKKWPNMEVEYIITFKNFTPNIFFYTAARGCAVFMHS